MKRTRAALLSIAVWTIPGLLTGAVAVLFYPVPSQLHGHLGRFASGFLASWWIWAALMPVIRGVMRRAPLERPWTRAIVVHTVFGVAAALAFTAWGSLMIWLGRPPSLAAETYATGFRRLLVGHAALGLAAYATVVAVNMALDERAARRGRELDAVRLQADLAQAQLRALQMQLQPHFLFNTLHAIAMLTDTEPRAAESMAVKLAELLRATLRLQDVPEVALGTELELLRTYLEIEEARFGERLVVSYAVPQEVLDLPVPSFLLQPIVENAVRHGVAPRVETGHVYVCAARDGRTLLLTVEDDGPGFSGDPLAAAGVGLSATRDRLSLRYGAAASLRCEARRDAGRGARVTIRIPLDATHPA